MECGSVSALSVDHSERLVPTRLHVVMCPHPVAKARMCVSTATSVCVCVHCSRCVCVCVRAHCSRCVCTWMGQMQRTHFTAGYTLYNYVCDKKKNIYIYIYIFFLPISDYGKMLHIGINIGKPIYRSIST